MVHGGSRDQDLPVWTCLLLPSLPAGVDSFWSIGKRHGLRANFFPATPWALLEWFIGDLTTCSVGAKELSSGTVQRSHMSAAFLPPQSLLAPVFRSTQTCGVTWTDLQPQKI